MKSGFVGIFGKPNSGKSTLLNALIGQKLAIISPKVQTTRHRIRGILSGKDYQIVFSDTPGIIEPKYKLHEKMMKAVESSFVDADLALLIVDANDDLQQNDDLFGSLRIKVPIMLIINKIDKVSPERLKRTIDFFQDKEYGKNTITISALKKTNIQSLLDSIVKALPEGEPFFEEDDYSDLPVKFFVSEMIREKIFYLYEEEVPYHSTVLIQEFKEKETLTKIRADIIVQRETQKGIILGEKGNMIKRLGTEARKDIEAFLQRKVFLELFVKVRPKWRDSELFLKEFGY
jgi:GTPase